MRNTSRFIFLVLVFLLVWIMWTGTLRLDELLTGVFLSMVVSAFTFKFFPGAGLHLITPKRIGYLLVYIPVFLWEMVKANIDVARRVLMPSLPIRPGIVKVKTNLKTEIGKLLLSNSITLTPGTFTVDVKGNHLYIHWIEVESMEEKEATKLIPWRFERWLKEFTQ